VPVIILSNANNDAEKIELLTLGADAFYAVADSEQALKEMLQKVKNNYLK
jgi:DNA-binding response OmpR family regulator